MKKVDYKLSYSELCALRVLFKSYICNTGVEPPADLQALYEFVCSNTLISDYQAAIGRFYSI